jgi:phosphomannomutase
VLIGKDTRISGYMLEAALEAGFAAGVDVWLAGPMPTPAVAYLTRACASRPGGDFGVAQSLSRQRHQVLLGQGNKLPDAVEADIEAALEQPMECVPPRSWARRAACRRGRSLHRILQEHLPQRHGPARHAPGGGLRPRRGLQHRRTCSTSWVPKSSPSATSPMA